MSWILSYAPNIPVLYDYITGTKKQNVVWIGSMEAIIALAYKRFRPNAKLKIDKDNFKITNDHSYNITVFNYNVDWQSVKRTVFGGKSTDLLSLKNPIYYSHYILKDIPKEDRDLLLNLALQSVNSLIHDTYADDDYAKDCLNDIRLILNYLIEGKNLAELANSMNISTTYADNPLTKKDVELWKNNKKWITDIVEEFKECLEHSSSGEVYEQSLNQIKKIMDKPHQEIQKYYSCIIKGT